MKKLSVDELLGAGEVKPANMNRELSVSKGDISRAESQIESIDLGPLLEKGAELFKEQAQMGVDGKNLTIDDIALSEAKSNSFLNAVGNALMMSHLETVAKADHLKFKREQEMQAMNPLLNAFVIASNVMEKKMGYIARQMAKTGEHLEKYEEEGVFLDSLGSVDELIGGVRIKSGGKKEGDGGLEGEEDRSYVNAFGEEKQFAPGRKPTELLRHLDGLQYVFDQSLNSLVKITEGVDKVVKLERGSGAREFGANRLGIPQVIQPSVRRKGLPGRSEESERQSIDGEVVREMSLEEMQNLMKKYGEGDDINR